MKFYEIFIIFITKIYEIFVRRIIKSSFYIWKSSFLIQTGSPRN